MITLETLERAIAVQFDQRVNIETRRQAVEYCDAVKLSDEGWKRCLEYLFQTDSEATKFFCLSTLEQHLSLRYTQNASPDEQTQLRAGLVTWLCEYVPSSPAEPVAVKNKFAQILSLMVWIEYPERWPDFFGQLFRLVDDIGNAALTDAQHVFRIDMLLRVLLAIDCDIVSRRDGVSGADSQRIAIIKDGMREQCIGRVIELAYLTILAYTSPQARGWRGIEQVVHQALQVLTRYVTWVDIELVVGQGRAAMLTSLLRSPEYRIDACAAIAQTVAKGMPAAEKLRLISNLRLKAVVLEVLGDEGVRKGQAEDEIAFLVSLGEIVNCMGVELCSSYDALRRFFLANANDGNAESQSQSAKEALDDLVQLLIQFLSSPDVAVSASVLDFCSEYLGKLKRTPKEMSLSARRVEHLRAILHVLCAQLRFPNEYDFRAPDEFEQAFNSYRALLDTLVKNASHLHPEFLADVINAMLVHLTPDDAPRGGIVAQSFADVECVGHLIFLSLEGARDDSHARLTPFIPVWLGRLLSHGVLRHTHHAVLQSFFDCCVRHSRPLANLQLPDGSPALMQVIEALLDERGMRASGTDALASELRQRASVAFARLARTLRNFLVPYTDELLQVCSPLLVVDINTVQTFSFAAQLSLYEALGTLVGSTPQRTAAATTVINTLLASVAALSSNNALRSGTAMADIGLTVLAQHINAISSFCKSFQLVPRRRNSLTTSSNTVSAAASLGESDGASAAADMGTEADRSMQEAYGALFLSAVDGVLAARVAASHSEEVRSATNTFLHCMVDTLGFMLLTRVTAIIDASMAGSTAPSLVEFTRLLCQLIDRFGERVRESLEQLLLPLLEQLITAVRATLEQAGDASTVAGGGRTDASLEAGELRRAYYTLLSAIAGKASLADILRSDALQPALGGILSTLIDGLAADDDRASQKSAAVTMTQLVRRWIDLVDAPTNPAMSMFGAFVWREAVPAGIATAVRVYVAHHARARASSAATAAAQLGVTSTQSVPLDAAAALAVQEVATVQQLLVQAHGNAALSAIGESAVGLGCNSDVVTQYLTSFSDAMAAGADNQSMRRLLLTLAETTAAAQLR